MSERAPSRRTTALASVTIVGAGKVGTALATSLRRARVRTRLVKARALPARLPACSMVVIAVVDARIAEVAAEIARALRRPGVIVHCAGALGPDVLAAVAREGHSVAQMHPLISIAAGPPPSLQSAALVVSGDASAVDLCRLLGERLGMRVVVMDEFDRTAYHAAAALAANGSATLAAVATELLLGAGFSSDSARALLGPLLRSVASNVERLGSQALTGPVRRGDADTVARHLGAIDRRAPQASRVACEIVRAQVAISTSIGEATPESLARIMRMAGDMTGDMTGDLTDGAPDEATSDATARLDAG